MSIKRFMLFLVAGAMVLTSVVIPSVVLAETTVEPEIMFYRDYEDYTGGAGWGNNGELNYGTFNATADSSFGWSNSKAVEGVTGKGFTPARPSGNISQGSFYHKYFPDSVKTAVDGRIYISFTSEDIPENMPDGVNGGNTSLFQMDTGFKYFGFTHGNKYGLTGWQTDNLSADIPEKGLKNYKIDLVFNIAEKLQFTYINNVLVAQGAWNTRVSDIQAAKFGLRFENGVIIDNLAMVYFPKNYQPTFSMTAVEADEMTDVFRVFLNSDAIDSDGKGSATKTAIAAPVGTALPSMNTSSSTYILDADVFSVDGMNVTNVTRGERPGEYVVEVDGDVEARESYTISAKPDLVDIMGATLNPGYASKTITVASKLTASVDVSNSTATVAFNDDIANAGEYSKGVVVKNIFTGETGTATLTKTASNKAEIGGYDFEPGDKYEVTLPDTIRGKKGNTLSDNVVVFNLATSNSIKEISLVDVVGNKHNLSEENTVALESIDFEFTADVTASEKTITITDENGTPFEDFDLAPSGNKTSLKLSKILAPGKTYTISVTGLVKNYGIILHTEDAKFDRVGVQFLDANDTALESIAVGDTVKVKMSFLNSTDVEESFVAAASLFAGLEMTNFTHKEITMKPVSDGGTGIHTETFTFTVSKADSGVRIKGHMWSEDEGKLWPIKGFECFE